MKLMSLVLFVSVFIIISAKAETLYPSGYNINCQYELSSQDVQISDTLTITRMLTNNESFSLSGLYFSDNFPAAFNLVDYSVSLNGSDILYQFEDSLDLIYPGNNCYSWIIDNPDGSLNNIINPGGVLALTIKLICNQAGGYTFPLHTIAFYGNNTGFFATDEAVEINVSSGIDNTPPAAITDLEAK